MFASMRKKRPYPCFDAILHCKSKTFNECLDILGEMFTRLGEAGMQVNLAKSTLMAKELKLLGVVLMRTCFNPTTKRIEAMLRLAYPRTQKRVRRFSSIVNFISNHISGRAAFMQSLTYCTKKDVNFCFGREE